MLSLFILECVTVVLIVKKIPYSHILLIAVTHVVYIHDHDSKHLRFIYIRGNKCFTALHFVKKDVFELDEIICDTKYYRFNGLLKLLQWHNCVKPTTFRELVIQIFVVYSSSWFTGRVCTNTTTPR